MSIAGAMNGALAAVFGSRRCGNRPPRPDPIVEAYNRGRDHAEQVYRIELERFLKNDFLKLLEDCAKKMEVKLPPVEVSIIEKDEIPMLYKHGPENLRPIGFTVILYPRRTTL